MRIISVSCEFLLCTLLQFTLLMLKYRISDALECEWFSVKTLMNFLTTTKQSPKTKHQLGTSFWFWQTTTFLRTLRLWSKSQNHKTTKSKEIIKLNQIHVFLKQSLFTHTSLGKLSLLRNLVLMDFYIFTLINRLDMRSWLRLMKIKLEQGATGGKYL